MHLFIFSSLYDDSISIKEIPKNTNENKFNELTEEEFDLNFEHYKADLEKQKLQEENREKSDNNLDEEK